MADEIRQAEVLSEEENQLLFGWGENIFGVAALKLSWRAEKFTLPVVCGRGARQSCRRPQACG